MFDLLLERQPVALDQFVECGLFWFVALVVICFGIGNRHRQAASLQQPWPFRIALLTSAVELQSGTPPWLSDPVQRDQVGGPFGRWLNPCSGRFGGDDRPLPIIHYNLEQGAQADNGSKSEVFRSDEGNVAQDEPNDWSSASNDGTHAVKGTETEVFLCGGGMRGETEDFESNHSLGDGSPEEDEQRMAKALDDDNSNSSDPTDWSGDGGSNF